MAIMDVRRHRRQSAMKRLRVKIRSTCTMALSTLSSLIIILSLVLMMANTLPSSSTYAFSLEGKTALVTGSAGGIGKGIAQILVDRGAKVIIHYNTREQEAIQFASDLGPENCLGVLQCDFTGGYDTMKQFMDDVQMLCRQNHYQTVEQACNTSTSENDTHSRSLLPPLDVLVNNAGVVSKLALEDDDDRLSTWHSTMDVNLHAPLFLSKLFAGAHANYQNGLRLATTRSDSCDNSDDNSSGGDGNADTNSVGGTGGGGGGGVILHVGSIHGERSNEYMGAYAASKAALESITRTMAIEFAPMNIRVNTIAPGVVPVERTAVAFSDRRTMKSWTDRLPLGRTGTVSEIAHACLPLIENDWITGSVWQVDGGMMSRANMPERPRPPR